MDRTLRSAFTARGCNHVALGLVDPSLVESWSGRRIDGVPDLAGNSNSSQTR
jgi:hypothetical protein